MKSKSADRNKATWIHTLSKLCAKVAELAHPYNTPKTYENKRMTKQMIGNV